MKSLGEVKQHLQKTVLSSEEQFRALADAGAITQTECAHLHGIIEKLRSNQSLTEQENRLVCETLINTNRMMNDRHTTMRHTHETVLEATDSSAVSVYPQEPPPLVVLRRKAIRMYPFNTKVALYYSDRLDRYFSVPYQTSGDV